MLDLEKIKDCLKCEDAPDRDVIQALVSEVERLRFKNQILHERLSESEEELDELYRINPFFKETPDA